jgi:hypothetical protein
MYKKMNMIRTVLFLIIFILSMNVHAQENGADSSDESFFGSILAFNSWIKKLSDEFEELKKDEKKKECRRKLGYIGEDLESLITKKEQILRLSAERPEGYKQELYKNISALGDPTQKLIRDIEAMDELINDNLGLYGNENVNRLSNELLNEKANMHTMMDRDLESGEFKKFRANAIRAIALLTESKTLVWALREKIK